MAYSDNYTLTKVYWKTYVEIYMDVYKNVYNQMKELYKKDEQALASAVATTMIAVSKAAGMDIAGIISWDASLAEQPDFKAFAEQKQHTGGYQGSQQKFGGGGGGYQKSGGYQKKAYDGPTELKGPASEKQVNKIHELLNDNDPKVQKVVADALAEMNVAAPEELSKQDASVIIKAGFDAGPKKPYKR